MLDSESEDEYAFGSRGVYELTQIIDIDVILQEATSDQPWTRAAAAASTHLVHRVGLSESVRLCTGALLTEGSMVTSILTSERYERSTCMQLQRSTGNQSRPRAISRRDQFIIHLLLDVNTVCRHISTYVPASPPPVRPLAVMPSRKLQNHSPSGPEPAAETPDIDPQDTYMPPSLARFYMTHLTVTLLHYQGFTSCQAEVIAELEKQVEDRE